jgi:hypothetical protein
MQEARLPNARFSCQCQQRWSFTAQLALKQRQFSRPANEWRD